MLGSTVWAVRQGLKALATLLLTAGQNPGDAFGRLGFWFLRHQLVPWYAERQQFWRMPMARSVLRFIPPVFRRGAIRRQRDAEWLERTTETELEVICTHCGSSVHVIETICAEDMGYRRGSDGSWNRPPDLQDGWARGVPSP